MDVLNTTFTAHVNKTQKYFSCCKADTLTSHVHAAYTMNMTDQHIIETLGGPAAMARLLGMKNPGGTRRIHNWQTRGIPSKIKVDHAKTIAKALKAAKVAT